MLETIAQAFKEVLVEFMGLSVTLGIGFLVVGTIIYQYEKHNKNKNRRKTRTVLRNTYKRPLN